MNTNVEYTPMELNEFNHYSNLPIEDFVGALGYKIGLDETNVNDFTFTSELRIKKLSYPVIFVANNKTWWIDRQELEYHVSILKRYKDGLSKYYFGYIQGTLSPRMGREGISSSMGEGYILWIKGIYSEPKKDTTIDIS